MQETWQRTNFISRYLTSLIFSVLIMVVILQIPIEYSVNVNLQNKTLAVKLIKNVIPNLKPVSVNSSPVTHSVSTFKPIITDMPMVNNTRSGDAKSTHASNIFTQEITTYNSENIENRASSEEVLYSGNSQNKRKEIDLNSEVNTESSDSFKHQLLNDHKKKRLAYLNEINQDLLKSRTQPLTIKIPSVLTSPPSLLPINKKESNVQCTKKRLANCNARKN